MPASPEVLVLHDEGFGAAVAQRLYPATTKAIRLDELPAAEDVPAGGVLVLALDLPAPRFERAADQLALARGTFLVPVVASHQMVRIGPVLGPGARATIDCHYRRSLQHSGATGHAELQAAYDEVETRRSQGFLPSLAAAAAASVTAVIRRIAEADRSDLQQITYLSGTSPRIGRHRLTGVHGNARSASTVSAEDRSWQALLPLARELAHDLSELDAVTEGALR
ncbi:hypothetical protein AB5J62_12835 [Amycolatopsis sp. cg5]|uniref:hypothetical protein n=1 Tax=Amycolatopsis sp. cg5 TaxID=3238802 RepID=UPI0035258790